MAYPRRSAIQGAGAGRQAQGGAANIRKGMRLGAIPRRLHLNTRAFT